MENILTLTNKTTFQHYWYTVCSHTTASNRTFKNTMLNTQSTINSATQYTDPDCKPLGRLHTSNIQNKRVSSLPPPLVARRPAVPSLR